MFLLPQDPYFYRSCIIIVKEIMNDKKKQIMNANRTKKNNNI